MRLAIGQSPMQVHGPAIYQLPYRPPEHSLNIHAKPENLLHVGHGSEEHGPESQTRTADQADRLIIHPRVALKPRRTEVHFWVLSDVEVGAGDLRL
jgi:hypothetical protein